MNHKPRNARPRLAADLISLTLRVVLTKSGAIEPHAAEQGLPDGLTEKAVEAARRIKFKPALRNGRPVSQAATVEYLFEP